MIDPSKMASASGRPKTSGDVRTPDRPCDPCKLDDEDNHAVWFCTVCKHHLCNSCGKAHIRTPALRDHKLLDLNNMPRQKMSLYEETTCLKHPNRQVEYYCKTHETCYCSICANTEHKRCYPIEYIDDTAKGFEKSKEYKFIKKDIVDLIKLLKKTKSESNKRTSHYERISDVFVTDVKDFKTKIDALLDSLIDTSLREIKCIVDSEIGKSDSVTKMCERSLAELSKLKDRMEEQSNVQCYRQLVISSKKAKSLVKTYKKEVHELPVQNEVRDIKFKPNAEIQRLLQNFKSIGTIGEESSDSSDSCDDSSEETDTECPAKEMVQLPDQSRGAGYTDNINVNHPEDNVDVGCWITGGALVGNDKIAFADRTNSCVKIVDINHNAIVSRVKLPKAPWHLTCGNKSEIVVTCDGGRIVFLRLNRNWSVIKTLNIGGDCMGIVYTNNTLFVTFDSPESSVKVLDMNGKLLKTLQTNAKGCMLFSRPDCISLSSDQKTVFVSDEEKNTVTILNIDGTVKHVYTDFNLECPAGIAEGRNGILYIAGFVSNNIHQLCTTCYHGEVMIDRRSETIGPRMVIYCQREHKLYISHNDVDSKDTVVSVIPL